MYRQRILLHHSGKAFIETGLENDTAGIDTGYILLVAADNNSFTYVYLFRSGLLFADNGNHDVCLMLFGCFFGLRPHVIVLRAFFGFAIRYGAGIRLTAAIMSPTSKTSDSGFRSSSDFLQR